MNLKKTIRYRVTLSVLFALTLFSSCSEEFDLSVPGAEPKLIVEGILTNEEGPYFVRLTHSSNEFGKTRQIIRQVAVHNNETDKYELVNDTIETKYNYKSVDNALVIISDNEGVSDTLKQFTFKEKTEFTEYKESKYTGSYKNYKGETISFNVFDPEDYNCYYYTTKIKGKSGNSYTLDIKHKNILYTSTETMLDVPEIDSVTFGQRISKEGSLVFDKPTVHFKNPPGDNYMLFTIGIPAGIYDNNTEDDQLRKFEKNSDRVWGFSVKSDKFLPDYVNGLRLPAGISDKDSYQNGFYSIHPGSKYVITMESISQHTFNYIGSLAKQFQSLGGVFHPTPSDPPGNISNGALGFFRVSAVSKSKGTMPSNAWN